MQINLNHWCNPEHPIIHRLRLDSGIELNFSIGQTIVLMFQIGHLKYNNNCSAIQTIRKSGSVDELGIDEALEFDHLDFRREHVLLRKNQNAIGSGRLECNGGGRELNPC
jgi:hypothetical protein